MKKYITYQDFYERMAFELRDKFEASDAGENDNSKILPFVEGMWVTSESINELLMDSKDKRKRVFEYVFDSDTKILEIPSNIGFLFAIRPSGTDTWINISDSSNLNATYVMIAEDTIKNMNDTGWVKGDIIEMNAVVFPDEITTADDPVVFPVEHQQLLRMKVLIKMFGRAEKEVPTSLLQIYSQCYQRWMANSSKVMAKKMWPQKGFGLGR